MVQKQAEALATEIGASRDSRLANVATEEDLKIAVVNLRAEIIKIQNEMAMVHAGLDQLLDRQS